MPQIAMAMLKINEIEADSLGTGRRPHEIADQVINLGICHDRIVGRDAKLSVE